jgi:hypothetical protein
MSNSPGKTDIKAAIVHFGRMEKEFIDGPFGVFLVCNGRVTAQCTGCEARESAETVARGFFSSFGASAIQEWERISIRGSDGAFIGITPKNPR